MRCSIENKWRHIFGGKMKKVIFKNSRNLDLVGNLYTCNSKTIVIMCHGFTSDKYSSGRFEKMVNKLNESKFDVLTFDFGGCGESEDEILTVENQVDDLKNAVNYVKSLGYTKLAYYGHSIGTLICLKCYTNEIVTMVLSGACIAPVYYNWNEYLTNEQMCELRNKGYTLLSAASNYRQHVKINQQTLEDFEQVNSDKLLKNVSCPVLIIHGNNDEEEKILLENTKNAIRYLHFESRIEVIDGATHSFKDHYYDILVNYSSSWFSRYLNI
jgi:pimeloyl-ACP methyl ester carboxylesterase